MIQLLGNTQGREAEAARDLRKLILESWPQADTDDKVAIHILAGAQCHGQKRRDLDLVLLATFEQPVHFRPFLDIAWGDGPPFRPKEAVVDSLCVIIELKEHDASGVHFPGAGRVEVRYFQAGVERWSDATQQNEEQKYSLMGYLQHHRLAAPYVSNLIWLKNLTNRQVTTPRPHNLLGSNSTWELFLSILFQLHPRRSGGTWLLSARLAESLQRFDQVVRLLTQTLKPTTLDRLRMDRIVHAALQTDWLDLLGKKQVIFRGRGGSGKTMILLQLAWKVFEERDQRVLFLTYNKALAADLKRLLALLGVSDDIGARSLQIQTVHSFVYSMLKGLRYLTGKEEDFLDRYEAIKEEVLEMLQSGAITEQDVGSLKTREPLNYRWDYLFIDEAQDWPGNERDLLRHLYLPSQFVLADGVDQLVRGQECDWKVGLEGEQTRTIALPACLRMKAALARFCNELALLLGLGTWKVQPNEEAPGGRVLILEGDYFADRQLHDELVARAGEAGNDPVDLLGCVPPALMGVDPQTQQTTSLSARWLREWGLPVWDGAVADVRNSYPVSPKELRVVQYDSCRGLEGWTTFLWGLDDFFQYKQDTWKPGTSSVSDPERQAFLSAARWLMIPLTRAIDTLVIQISNQASPLRAMLEQVAEQCKDFVEWRKM